MWATVYAISCVRSETTQGEREVVNGRVDAGGERKAVGVKCDEVVDSYLRSQAKLESKIQQAPGPLPRTQVQARQPQQSMRRRTEQCADKIDLQAQHTTASKANTTTTLFFIFCAQIHLSLAVKTAQACVPAPHEAAPWPAPPPPPPRQTPPARGPSAACPSARCSRVLCAAADRGLALHRRRRPSPAPPACEQTDDPPDQS